MNNHIDFYCRGKCQGTTTHEIENTLETNNGNFAKLKCIKCNTPPFVIQYPAHTSPTQTSRRVGGDLIGDEQPEDVCYFS